jgi:hypothetical protein
MSIIVSSTMEKGASTTLNAWKKVFQGGEHGTRCEAAIRAYAGNNASYPIWVAIRSRGGSAPSSPAVESDAMYAIYPGDTLNIGSGGEYRVDIYIATSNGSVQTYSAWESVP